MKKIFFLLTFMHVGGVERSFLSLLRTLPREEYEVHLGLLKMTGDLMGEIPPWVKVHHIDYFEPYQDIINEPPKTVFITLLRKGQVVKAVKYARAYLAYRNTGSHLKLYKSLLSHGAPLSEHYNIAVAYAGPSDMVDYYVSQKVDADKKIGWIHFDISKFGCDKDMVRALYPAFDHINVVSKSAKDVFDMTFPSLSAHTRLRYNEIDFSYLKDKADQGQTFPADTPGTKILTIGRLTHEKGPDIAIETAARLVQKGIRFTWYIIGPNPESEKYAALQESLGVKDYVKITGAMANPYGYLRDCDIYVQPSRHEGWGLTVQEAKSFGRPIIATDCPSLCEQLADYPLGYTCKPDSDALSAEIIKHIKP